MSIAEGFWQRVDELCSKEGISLHALSDRIEVPYQTVKGWRCRKVLPKIELVVQISEIVDASLDFLIKGKESGAFSDEAIAVDFDDKLKALVRAIQRDNRLLSAISAIVESYESNHYEENV